MPLFNNWWVDLLWSSRQIVNYYFRNGTLHCLAIMLTSTKLTCICNTKLGGGKLCSIQGSRSAGGFEKYNCVISRKKENKEYRRCIFCGEIRNPKWNLASQETYHIYIYSIFDIHSILNLLILTDGTADKRVFNDYICPQTYLMEDNGFIIVVEHSKAAFSGLISSFSSINNAAYHTVYDGTVNDITKLSLGQL